MYDNINLSFFNKIKLILEWYLEGNVTNFVPKKKRTFTQVGFPDTDHFFFLKKYHLARTHVVAAIII